MTLETYELDKLMQQYSISQFRNIPEYVKICEAFCVGLASIQTAVNYLSEMQNVETAEGIWLDYIAWLVGTTREAYNILNFFCVNAPHLNVEKLFYFEGITPDSKGSLQDVLLRKRIRAKIAYNTSRATRNENIRIIQGMFNADKVVISKPKIFDNFTTVGSPTITDDGIASGFSDSSYLAIDIIDVLKNGSSWKIEGDFTVGSDITTNQTVIGKENALRIRIVGGLLNLLFQTTDTSWVVSSNLVNYSLSANTHYYYKFYFTGSAYRFDISTDNTTFINLMNRTDSTKLTAITVALGIGSNYGNTPFLGSIDLKQLSITVDGVEVYRPYREVPMLLDITLYGDNIIYPSIESIRGSIENILGCGVGVRNLDIEPLSAI